MPRTTVELPKRELAELRALAARRGMHGFSELVADAVREYLERRDLLAEEESFERFRSARGALKGERSKELRAHVRRLRTERW